jgi:hypothetical protein
MACEAALVLALRVPQVVAFMLYLYISNRKRSKTVDNFLKAVDSACSSSTFTLRHVHNEDQQIQTAPCGAQGTLGDDRQQEVKRCTKGRNFSNGLQGAATVGGSRR